MPDQSIPSLNRADVIADWIAFDFSVFFPGEQRHRLVMLRDTALLMLHDVPEYGAPPLPPEPGKPAPLRGKDERIEPFNVACNKLGETLEFGIQPHQRPTYGKALHLAARTFASVQPPHQQVPQYQNLVSFFAAHGWLNA